MKFVSSMKSSRGIFSAFASERGFTLIELIMVIIFLSVAFVATLGMMSTGIEESVDTEILTKAITLAEQKMEVILGDKNGLGYQYLENANYNDEQNVGGYSGFTRTVQITTYSTYKEVVVKVKHNGIKDVVLTTQMTNY